MASGNIESEDTSILNPIIDNEKFAYFIQISSVLDANDIVVGARIKYIIEER